MPRPDFIVIGRIIGIALTAALAIALIWSGIDDMGRLGIPAACRRTAPTRAIHSPE